MADRRDILESKLQEFLRQQGIDLRPWQRDFLVQYLYNRDRQADHMCTQDEASETRAVGDRVRPERYLNDKEAEALVVDEYDLCKKIRDEFTMDLAKEFAKYDKVPMIRYEEDKKPDGSVVVRYIFAPFDK